METVEFIRVPGPEVASGDGMPSGGLPAFSVFQSVRNLVKSGLGEGTGLGCLGREKTTHQERGQNICGGEKVTSAKTAMTGLLMGRGAAGEPKSKCFSNSIIPTTAIVATKITKPHVYKCQPNTGEP